MAYCALMLKHDTLPYKWISNILTHSAGTFGTPAFGSARTALPTCDNERKENQDENGISEECWMRVATDRGLCFASYTGEILERCKINASIFPNINVNSILIMVQFTV